MEIGGSPSDVVTDFSTSGNPDFGQTQLLGVDTNIAGDMLVSLLRMLVTCWKRAREGQCG